MFKEILNKIFCHPVSDEGKFPNMMEFYEEIMHTKPSRERAEFLLENYIREYIDGNFLAKEVIWCKSKEVIFMVMQNLLGENFNNKNPEYYLLLKEEEIQKKIMLCQLFDVQNIDFNNEIYRCIKMQLEIHKHCKSFSIIGENTIMIIEK